MRVEVTKDGMKKNKSVNECSSLSSKSKQTANTVKTVKTYFFRFYVICKELFLISPYQFNMKSR